MTLPPTDRRPAKVLPVFLRGALLGALLVASPGCKDSGPDLTAPPSPEKLAGGLDDSTQAELRTATDAVLADPGDADLWAALGRAYESKGVHEGAETTFSSAAQLRPDDPKLRYRAAIAAGKAGELERALGHLDRVLDLDATYGPAWRRRGSWLLDLGRADEARAAFERALPLLPGVPDAPIGLARAALALDEITVALEHARTAFERAPDDPYVRLILGNALRRSGEADEALPHLDAGQGALPRYVDPWSENAARARRQDDDLSERANRLVGEKQWDAAIEALEELRELRPQDSRVALRLGVALIGGGYHKRAEEHYEAMHQEFPANYDIATSRAAALRASGKTARSLSAIDAVIARWPDRAPAYLQRGSTLAEMNDVTGARAAFQRASQLNPGDLRGPLFEGQLLAKLRRYPEAAQVLQAGLDLPGASPPLVYFRMLLSAQAASRMGGEAIQATLDRARAIHGDAADSLTKKR